MNRNINELKLDEIKDVSGGVTYATATATAAVTASAYPTKTYSAPTYSASIYDSTLAAPAPSPSLPPSLRLA
ncbi:MAG: hypothetical protein U1E23_14965 [Reyranellaceae bacterium]